MSTRVSRCQLWLLVWIACAAIGAQPRAQQIGRAPVDVQVPQPPTPVAALGRLHLVYELHVTNFGAAAVTLEQLEVSSEAGLTLANWDASQVTQRMIVVGAPPSGPGLPKALQPGARAIVFIWISLTPGQAAPGSLTHRLTLSPGGGEREAVTIAPVQLLPPAPSVGPPVRGGYWLGVRGPSATSPHRLSVVAASGQARVPQRFAIDLALLGEDGLLFSGKGTELASWYSYDVPVYAVAAGTVVMTRDGIPDHPPLGAPPPATMAAAEAPGNIVVIDIGQGRFVTYAHLKPGSIEVAKGDRVADAQPLARIGNSGNTLGPHLHFQVANAVEPLAGEGLPFSIRNFELAGRVLSIPALLGGAGWQADPAQPARTVTDEMPLENMVLRLGSAPPGPVRRR
jgi:murein DD-endopeptidase MepM/ murein hydrolase activator NlpD